MTKPNTSCIIEAPASLRSENRSPSARNAVRVPFGISVHLHRNPHIPRTNPKTVRRYRKVLEHFERHLGHKRFLEAITRSDIDDSNCFFVIEHGCRRILHFNITPHPTADWVVQQSREAFPEAAPYRYVILDRDTKFDTDVITFLKTGLKPKRTSVQAPWQNGIAERFVGSCRRESLAHGHRAEPATFSPADARLRGLYRWFALTLTVKATLAGEPALGLDPPSLRRPESLYDGEGVG